MTPVTWPRRQIETPGAAYPSYWPKLRNGAAPLAERDVTAVHSSLATKPYRRTAHARVVPGHRTTLLQAETDAGWLPARYRNRHTGDRGPGSDGRLIDTLALGAGG